MKQAIYADQVVKAAKYRDLMETMVEVAEVRGVDAGIVAELRAMAETKNLHDGSNVAPARPEEDAAVAEPRGGFLGRLWGGT